MRGGRKRRPPSGVSRALVQLGWEIERAEMAEVALAFLWHQHQPYYPDDLAGQNPMPWVRLHGVKDYYGMAMHLLEVPEMHCTINLVPCMLRQLEAYTDHGATDRFLLASREPADALSEASCLYLLDHFFMAHPDHMIRPFPRYAELYRRRGPGRNASPEVVRRFQEKDWRDLQVWFNLAWIHPIAFERDAELRDFRKKGKHYTEAEKSWLLDKHIEILKQVIPLHRRLEESGQVELTTTPFYHPILPLLLDKKLAREALPDVKLPRYASGYPGRRGGASPGRDRGARAPFRAAAPRDVAGGRIGLPEHAPAVRTARHSLDCDRRGDPQLLDTGICQPRQPWPRAEPEPHVPTVSSVRGRS